MDAYDALLTSSDVPEWPGGLECAAPSVIPSWVLELEQQRHFGCACCCDPDDLADPAVPEAAWSAPGVTGLGPVEAGPLPPPSPVVAALQRAVERVVAVRPSQVDAAQALSDAQALLQVEQQLRVHDLTRLADVHARGLTDLVGARSVKAWVREHRPDGDPGDALLANRLRTFPVLDAAVQDRRVSLGAARKTAGALRTCGPHLDRPEGLIDGLPGDLVLNAVVGNVAGLICRELQGLHDDDPRLQPVIDRAQTLLSLEGTQAERLEHTLLWLAEAIAPRALAGALDEIVVAVLPSLLEDRAEKGHERRGLSITELPDGQGWHLCGALDLECGERLWTVLRAAAAHDTRNPDDTAAWADARDAGATEAEDVWGPLGARLDADGALPHGLPRGRRKRLHDAFSNALERYLAAGLGGLVSKTPVQIHVTIPEASITGTTTGTGTGTSTRPEQRRPGAPPPRADSGRLLPRSLVRRWWCDSHVTTVVLSLGGKALRTIHSQRTLTADERRALDLEGAGRCAGDGCCPGLPDPLIVLRPHHVLGYAEDQITSLDETLNVCDTLHHDLHTGKRTVQLRDGRWLNENGLVTHPTWHDQNPPF